MIPRIALLILVLGSAASASQTYSSNSGSMISSLMTNNLALAMALSRFPLDERSWLARDQSRAKSTESVVRGNKKVWNARKRLMFGTPKGFFEKEQNKEAQKLFSFRKAIMKQAVLLALKKSLTQQINQGVQRRSSYTVNSRIRLL